MARTNVETMVAALAAQLAALQGDHARLARQLATLAGGQHTAGAPLPPAAAGDGRPNRRQVLARLGAGAAATLGASALLDGTTQPAAAASGGALTLGRANLAEATTQLAYDGATPIAGKIVFLANDTALASTSATYPAALAGWAGGGKAGVPTGVAGQTGVAGGNRVVGCDVSADGSGGVGVRATSRLGIAVYAVGDIAVFAQGNLSVHGNKSAVVPAEDGYLRTLYCMESRECWFEDFGSAELVNGAARVPIEPLFAATIRTDQYHIFLTPLANCKGLYVSSVDAAGFTVQELQGGASTLAFSYRVVARRKDTVAPRLKQVRPPRVAAATGAPATPPQPAAPAAPAQPVQRPELSGVQQPAPSPAVPPMSMPAMVAPALQAPAIPMPPPQAPAMPAPLPPVAAPQDQ